MSDKKKLALPENFVCDMGEQETVITTMRGDKRIRIYTSDNTMLTKLKKLMGADGGQYEVERVEYLPDGSACGVVVTAPARCLSLRSGKTREISEEDRAALAERMRNIATNRK